MQTTDLAIKYKNLYQTAELMLDNIKSLGFDVSEYEAILKSISTNIHNNIKVNYTKGFAKANYELDYSSGIAELNRLINQLDKYDVYFKVLNSCEWLNIKINSQDITNEELKKYVSEMAYNLKQLVKSDTIDYDNEKHIVEMVYEIAYKLIKLELSMTGISHLYEYIKREDINISYFNIIIKREIIELQSKQKDATLLREKIFQIRKDGISSTYFDLDLIRNILIYSGDNRLKNKINENMHNLVAKINDNIQAINELTTKTNEVKDEKAKWFEVLREDGKNIVLRFISFIVATSVIVGAGIGVQRLSKKIATSDKYLKTTEIYSTITDDTTTEIDDVIMGLQPSNRTMVRVWEPYDSKYERTYKDYDVSYLDFDTAREYYEYGIDNDYGVVPEVDKQYYSDIHNTDIPNYQDSYTEVSKVTYEYQGKGLNESGYKLGLWIGYILYTILLVSVEVGVIEVEEYPIITGTIFELANAIGELLFEDKESYKLTSDELIQKINTLEELINQDETLRKEFNRLYEANKYLLDNPEELTKKINEIDYSEAKKLVRMKKKN